MPYKRGQKWIAQVRKEGQRLEKVFLSKTKAKDWEAKMRRKPVEEWNVKTDTVFLGDWAQAYLDVAKVRFSTKTYKEKASMFKRFLGLMDAAMPVSELKPAHVLDYIIKQKEERSGYGANKDRKNLVAAWNWGMKYMDPVLPAPNPCLVERMPEIRQPRYVPAEEDFWKIYSVAEGQDKVMLLAFLHLAARRGEIFRLTWADVDFGASRIRLWTRKRQDGTFEYDWLPMTKDLRRSLRWWWEYRPIKDHTHVFLCLNEHPGQKENFGHPFVSNQKFMRRICKAAGVKNFGFHAIRHLTASILYHHGEPLAHIQAILRHRSPTTTERYLKSIGLERVREALESLSNKSGKADVIEFDKVQETGESEIQKGKAV
ncbi:MAG: site-specific integrase [Deltaproteobacteria bacterium]|nr:site-specific integrase [Deltaproteobacteria bacterium]